MSDQITVIGITGTVGSRVTSKLAAREVQVRGIARDPSQFSGNQNVELVAADSMPISPERRTGGVSGEDIANAAVDFFEKGPQNRGFDLYLPDGVTGPMIAEAASHVLERPVQFYEFTDPIPEYVAGFPIGERHKELYVELFTYFQRQDYLGQPNEIISVLPHFRYTTVEQFMRLELFAT